MRRDLQALLLALVGGMVLNLVLSGTFDYYVKDSLSPWLAVSGGILVVLGLWSIIVYDADVRRASRESAPASTGEDHGHHGPRIAWLLALPLVTVALVAPPALNSYAASRDSGKVDYEVVSAPEEAADDGLRLPPGEGPVELDLISYGYESMLYEGESFEGRQIALVGFVGAESPSQGLVLTRMTLFCCAADGQAVKVVTDAQEDLPPDTWVRVVGDYAAPVDLDGTMLPAIEVDSITEVPEPQNRYI